jgi:hypothetical protein
MHQTPETETATEPIDLTPPPADAAPVEVAAEAAPEVAAEAPAEPAPEEPAPVVPEPPKYRVIARERHAVDVPLTTEERMRAAERAAERSDTVMQLEEEHKLASKREAAEAKLRREEIEEAKEALRAALGARHTGIERRYFEAERRAMVASATIELVLVETGEIVDSRAMSESEQAKWCRQGDITDVTGGATVEQGIVVGDDSGDEQPADDSAEREPAKEPVDADDEAVKLAEENDAMGLPEWWPRAWRDKEWKAGKDEVVTAGDVREVYIRLPEAGRQLDMLLEGVASFLTRAQVTKALALLKKQGRARKLVIEGEPVVWASCVPDESEPEPGRSEEGPEAADPKQRPRRIEPATHVDRLLADAAGVAEVYAAPVGG